MELFADADSDKRLLWRMEKPPSSPIRPHAPSPEDGDDDFATSSDIQSHKQSDESSSSSSNAQPRHHATTDPAASAAPAAPLVVVTQSPSQPALNHPLKLPDPSLGLNREHTSSGSDGNASKRVDQREIRSEPSRHGYNTISANPIGTTHPESNHSGSSGSGGEQQGVLTRLLPSLSPSPQALQPTRANTTPQDFWRAVTASAASTAGYGSSSSQGRRHSILRFGSSRRPKSERSMKKSASVEFKLHEEAHLKHPSSDTRHYSSNTLGREMPRRLTEEEKEELYRIRPDLEISPTPFFKEQMAELNRRNQKRVLFAMFGGLISILLLLVFYALLVRG